MPQLHIWVDPRRGDSSPYQPLLPDETVSSWVARHPFIELSSDDREYRERDFGALTLDLPGAGEPLMNALRRAAAPPDAWLLRPDQRTLVCARCQAVDWSFGTPCYQRRAWCVAWRTCCALHGMLFDTELSRAPTWSKLLLSSSWSGAEVALMHKRPFGAMLALGLHGDRRAIHLEAALDEENRQAAWFPKGLTDQSLRDLYQTIVTDLLAQFYLRRDGPLEERPNSGFNRSLNPNRFSINVLAEAILSEWTQTPLPDN